MANRDKNGCFAKGHKGFKNVGKYRKLKKHLLSNEDALIQQVIDLALAGDVGCLKLCFSKLYGFGAMPSMRLSGKNPLEVSRNLLSSVGSVDAETLNGAARLLETHLKVVEAADFEERLKKLEDAR